MTSLVPRKSGGYTISQVFAIFNSRKRGEQNGATEVSSVRGGGLAGLADRARSADDCARGHPGDAAQPHGGQAAGDERLAGLRQGETLRKRPRRQGAGAKRSAIPGSAMD